MVQKIVLFWFRQDLRLKDHPALAQASSEGTVFPIYILDEKHPKMGAASSVWLHHSLHSLNLRLDQKLSLYRGNARLILAHLCERYSVQKVIWSRCYEPWRVREDQAIEKDLCEKGIEVETFNTSLLWEPWEVYKNDGKPYKVFTPFFKKGCLEAPSPRKPIDTVGQLDLLRDVDGALDLGSLGLLPDVSWDESLVRGWEIGEEGAQKRFSQFLQGGLKDYKEGRDFPSKSSVSRLSPSLHFGEISPNQLWYEVQGSGDDENVAQFCLELGWREFSYSLLYYNPLMQEEPLQYQFKGFPWKEKREHLIAWRRGQTGIPMVDAAMRELWQTGYMHNRSRMIVGSFLVKNLLIDWREGERWFWDCLFDADLANNCASWQWVAGCGADAAPYFRIFNPVTQGQKFDPEGCYVRRYVPELRKLSNRYLFSPWEAPRSELESAGVELGVDYPLPIVDLKRSREEALSAYYSMRE